MSFSEVLDMVAIAIRLRAVRYKLPRKMLLSRPGISRFDYANLVACDGLVRERKVYALVATDLKATTA